jgi:hypothetical protein
LSQQNETDMKVFKNATGSKGVKITTDAEGKVRAMYYQVYNGEEQLLHFKTFANTKNAEKWASKKLS